MIQTNEYRTSLERHNAPFRGVSSRSDYVNFQLAVSHDLLHVFNLSGGNVAIDGHKQETAQTLSAVMNGTEDLTRVRYSAGVIKTIEEEFKELSNLNNWTVPPLTYGEVSEEYTKEIQSGETISYEGTPTWRLIPPETDRGFFELEHLLHVKAGDKLLIRFKPKHWDPSTVYQFGALNFDSNGHNFKKLEVDNYNSYTELSNRYFEHILRFDEERDVRLAIQTTNTVDGVLGNEPLTLEEFGIYSIEETPVYTRSLETELKPMVEAARVTLKRLEERRL